MATGKIQIEKQMYNIQWIKHTLDSGTKTKQNSLWQHNNLIYIYIETDNGKEIL